MGETDRLFLLSRETVSVFEVFLEIYSLRFLRLTALYILLHCFYLN